MKKMIYSLTVLALAAAVFAACSGTGAKPESPEEEIIPPLENPDKWAALTWDDGPSASSIALLDILKRNSIKGTFFVLGDNIGKNSAGLRRMIADGHEIGSHSWSHPYLTGLPEAAMRKELTDTSDEIKKYTSSPTLFRPPFIDYNDAVKAAAAQLGMSLILCDVSSDDWQEGKTTDQIIQHLTAPGAVKDGSIILFHDHANDNSRRAIAQVVQALRAQGFEFTTVSDLARRRNKTLVPGQEYWSLQ